MPVAVVVFPYALQFEDSKNSSGPQQIVREAVASQRVPVLDLLPVFESEVEEQSLALEDIFLDANHLAPLGHEMAARSVVRLLQDEALLEFAAQTGE